MRRLLLVSAVLFLLCSAASGKERDVVRLKAVEPWNLHYADDSCRLARAFGTGKEQVILVLDQFEPGDWFRVTFVGDLLAKSVIKPKGSLRFGPNEAESQITIITGTVSNKSAVFVEGDQRLAPLTEIEEKQQDALSKRGIKFDPAPVGRERETQAMWLALGKVLRDDLILDTESMAKPLAGLRDCSWATVKMWGLNVEEQKRLTRKVERLNTDRPLLTFEDYPSSMARGGFSAVVNFRLMVDASGKATSCHIQESTRPKEFDDTVCRAVMRRARFRPALNAQGKPVASYWRQTVRFYLIEG